MFEVEIAIERFFVVFEALDIHNENLFSPIIIIKKKKIQMSPLEKIGAISR